MSQTLVCLQTHVTRLCIYKPTFIAAIEHSDDDLQALLDKLATHSDIAARLTAAQFHANPSKSSSAAAARTLRASLNYTELFPEAQKKRVDALYASDFAAFGYAKDLNCI